MAAPLDPTIESAALVAEVIDRVRREYVDSVDDKRIVEAAIRGIVADLDQHSTFLDAEEYEDIRISTTGNYTGVGLDVNLEGGKVTVVTPLEGAPAERAGILPATSSRPSTTFPSMPMTSRLRSRGCAAIRARR